MLRLVLLRTLNSHSTVHQFVCFCLCVCSFFLQFVCMRACVRVYVCMRVHARATNSLLHLRFQHACKCAREYACVCTCLSMHVYVGGCAFMRACVCVWMYVHARGHDCMWWVTEETVWSISAEWSIHSFGIHAEFSKLFRFFRCTCAVGVFLSLSERIYIYHSQFIFFHLTRVLQYTWGFSFAAWSMQ